MVGPDVEAAVTQAMADGRMSTGDGTEVLDFARFLREAGPPPNQGGDPVRFLRAVRWYDPRLFAEVRWQRLTEDQARWIRGEVGQ